MTFVFARSTVLAVFACYLAIPGANALRRAKGGKGGPLRFKKLGTDLELPQITYPMTKQTAPMLAGTAAVSVRWFGHAQVDHAAGTEGTTFTGLTTAAFGTNSALLPTHPDDAQSDAARFWDEFREVLAAQLLRRRGENTAAIMAVHPLFDAQPETLQVSAFRVQADFPTDFPTQQIKLFGKALAMDPAIFRRAECGCNASTQEFVNGAVALSGLAGWAVTEVSPAAFGLKWHAGRMRPEEVAWLISTGQLQADADIQEAIRSMDLASPEDFTAYPEGSPPHPAWPAMHSAASSLSSWLDVVADLTKEQREQVRLLDYSVAYLRTVAGVHYETDNRAGLAVGQHIIRSKIADFLAERYSCDAVSKKNIKNHVLRKIRKLQRRHPLDWSTWVPAHWQKPLLSAVV